MYFSKFLSAVLATAALSVSFAYAGNLNLTVNNEAYLPDCGGKVEVTNKGGQVNLVFRSVERCSNFDILDANGAYVDYQSRKIGSEQDRTGSFTISPKLLDYGFNRVRVVVKSNSGKTQDVITVRAWAVDAPRSNPLPRPLPQPLPPTSGDWTYTDLDLTIGQAATLPSCGGTVEVTSSPQGSGDQVNLIFSGVRNCSNFEIGSYYAKKLTLDGNRQSFTLPKRFANADGWNDVRIVVESNSGKHADRIRVVFVNIPNGNGGGTKLPSTPNTGGGW